MENITIRESTYDDIPSLLELLYELGRPKPQTDSDVFNKMLEFKSNDDGISYEYVDFDDDEDEGDLALQDDEDISGALGRLMNT